MKYPLLQPLTAQGRSRLLSRRHWFVLPFITLMLLLLTDGVLLPRSIVAQPIALTSVSSIVSQPTFAPQPIASAPVQVSAIVVNRLRQDLSHRTTIPTAKLKLLETTPKTWTDGCFGLAKPGEICTQALVEGWRVVFSNGSQRWIYRTDKQGRGYRLEP